MSTIYEPNTGAGSMSLFVGRYRLDETLGEEGPVTIYRAWDTQLRRPVVLHVMEAPEEAAPAEREAFLNEAKALARFNHPNVTLVHDGGMAEGMAFLVTEWAGEATLGSRLLDGPLPVEEARRIGIELAGAAGAARAAGIGPLNLRTAGIGFGADGRAKVSPVRGIEPEPRGDVYALGYLLYELLTGRPPVTTGGAIASPRELNPEVPPSLSAVVMQALSPQATSLFPTPSALGAALKSSGASSEAPTLRHPAVSREAWPPPAPVPRGRRLWPLMVIAMLLVILTGAYLVQQAIMGIELPAQLAQLAQEEATAPPSSPTAEEGDPTSTAEAPAGAATLEPTPAAPSPSPEEPTATTPRETPTATTEKPEPPAPGQRDRLFPVQLASRSRFVATMRDISPGVDYDLYLYDDSGQELARSTELGNAPEQIEMELPPGSYTIRAYYFEGAPDQLFDVRWQWFPVTSP